MLRQGMQQRGHLHKATPADGGVYQAAAKGKKAQCNECMVKVHREQRPEFQC
jgi:hypothetical protein